MKVYTKILFHDVEYWHGGNEVKGLTEDEKDYIEHMIIKGYSSGQLISYDDSDQELSGWWQIKGYETQ